MFDSAPKQKTFDVHLASDVLSGRLEAQLRALGFTRDAFIGGTTGVVHPQHFSNRPLNVEELRKSWNNAIRLLSKASADEFHGYAEAEMTPPQYRAMLRWKPFDSSVPIPLGTFEYHECPIEQYKDVDIHLTANLDSLDSRLKSVLEDRIGFHYVDIRRQNGLVVRVYTVQPLRVKGVRQLYFKILDYINTAGGLEGKIKLEVTYRFARFPADAAVCPVITDIPNGVG